MSSASASGGIAHGQRGLVVVAAIVRDAAISRRWHRHLDHGPMVFVTAGLLFGVQGLDWLHLTANQDTVSSLAEATLVVVLFTGASASICARCDRSFLSPRACWESVCRSRSLPVRLPAHSCCTA
jgi:hypothetical protein